MNSGLRNTLFASIGLTLFIYWVPFGRMMGRPLVWLSTLAHELGHGFTALLVGGQFGKLMIYADASGVAWTAVDGRLASAAVAAGGLVGPSVAAAMCFLAARSERTARILLALAAAWCVMIAVVWVRNLFGFAFVMAFGFSMAAVAWKFRGEVARFMLVFLGVQLSLNVFSRADYLFTATARTAQGTMPSDVAKIAEALMLPYWFWGGLCGLFSVLVLVMGLWLSLFSDDDGEDPYEDAEFLAGKGSPYVPCSDGQRS